MQIDTDEITRFEVIDHTSGRVYYKGWPLDEISIELSVQDSGRTLKVFVNQNGKGTPRKQRQQ
jgi:hypothetical protein